MNRHASRVALEGDVSAEVQNYGNPMNKVLVISYYYPPLADVGGKRTVRFVDNMKDFGWYPHVLTVKNPDLSYCIRGTENPPSDVPVTRALSIVNTYTMIGKSNGALHKVGRILPFLKIQSHLQERLTIPDPTPGWLPAAYFLGKKLIRRKQVDLIYASVGPLGCGLLAQRMSKKFGIPFVIDARDPVSCRIFENKDPRSFQEHYLADHEASLVADCEYFVCTSEATLINYQKTYPRSQDKFKLIYNGYDHVASERFALKDRDIDKFRIIYLGNFYHYALDPNPFFEALRRFIDSRDGLADRIVFWLLGEHDNWLEQIINKYSLEHIVRPIGRVDRSKMMAYLQSADLFFLRNPFPTNIGAKLFDGLAVEIPMLSTYTHSEIENLIRRYAENYTILADESVEKLTEALGRHYQDYESGRLSRKKSHNTKFITEFGGRRLTQKLCTLFDTVGQRVLVSANSK